MEQRNRQSGEGSELGPEQDYTRYVSRPLNMSCYRIRPTLNQTQRIPPIVSSLAFLTEIWRNGIWS